MAFPPKAVIGRMENVGYRRKRHQAVFQMTAPVVWADLSAPGRLLCHLRRGLHDDAPSSPAADPSRTLIHICYPSQVFPPLMVAQFSLVPSSAQSRTAGLPDFGVHRNAPPRVLGRLHFRHDLITTPFDTTAKTISLLQ
ncbi:hypothetical protein CPAR01_08040 [Colletotrichum paranaense]|uniref:Uncharacterized protein n=1 Tax=Colletotrichum paranaense TaxID=1914294 RepID=A0ABQ9SKC7_9PEZI|nr:uncharacterized protein CPAR01_08040 [Colletotrichum paranaense]KAK1537927.1 hypothetical protein CPAR01_08040 [Colletotrichum paranaense]